MLKETDMTKIEAILGMEGGALKVAIESDDSKEITIPTGQFVDTATHQVFSNEELTTREDTLKRKHEKAGGEIDIKNYKRDKEWDFDGKSLDHLLKFSNDAAVKEAGIAPDEKNKSLQEKNDKLVKLNEAWEVKHDGLLERNKHAETKRTTDTGILSHMKGDYSITTERMLTNFNAEHSVTTSDGVQVISRGGVKLEDSKTFAPLSMESVVAEWTKDFAKNPTGGGGGGDNGGGAGGGSLDVFRKQQEDAGVSYESDAYMRAEAKAVADGTLVLT